MQAGRHRVSERGAVDCCRATYAGSNAHSTSR